MKEKLSASVKKYSDITTRQVDSDSVIKTITVRSMNCLNITYFVYEHFLTILIINSQE